MQGFYHSGSDLIAVHVKLCFSHKASMALNIAMLRNRIRNSLC